MKSMPFLHLTFNRISRMNHFMKKEDLLYLQHLTPREVQGKEDLKLKP